MSEATGIQEAATGVAEPETEVNAELNEDGTPKEEVAQTEEEKAAAAAEEQRQKKQNHRDRRIEGMFSQNAALRGQVDRLSQQIAELQNSMTVKAADQNPAPDPTKYPDVQSFIAAQNNWLAAEVERRTESAIKKHQPQNQQPAGDPEWLGRTAAFKAENADFDAVIRQADSDGVQLPNNVLEIIRRASDGPALLYHIAKNPDVANELMSVTPADAALQLGEIRVEIKAARKKTPPVSKAAPPAHIPKGTGEKARKSPEEETPTEYAKRRNAEERKLHPERFR